MTTKNTIFRIFTPHMERTKLFSLRDDGELLEGSIPKNKQRLIQAWIEIHREDLLTDWQLAVRAAQERSVLPLLQALHFALRSSPLSRTAYSSNPSFTPDVEEYLN